MPTELNTLDDLALSMHPGISERTAVRLVGHFGSSSSIFNSSRQELSDAGINPRITGELVAKICHRTAEAELRECEKNRITVLTYATEDYPELLRECCDHPLVLYVYGNIEALKMRMLSVVGTRRMSPYGSDMCRRIIADLACDYGDLCIVSGLAYGIDGASHRAALENSVTTVGVMGTPWNKIYPSQHRALAEQIVRSGGALVTEYHSASATMPGNFVARNRIIAGLSQGTIIVESSAKGGSLITASLADSYDRSVMAVPGRVGDSNSEGANNLIKYNRARMVCSAEDVARELMWDIPVRTDGGKKELDLSPEARAVYEKLKAAGNLDWDSAAVLAGADNHSFAAVMMELEMADAVRMLPGKIIEACG